MTEDIKNNRSGKRFPDGSRIPGGSAGDKNQNMESLQDKNPAAEAAVHRSFTRNLLGALAVICAIGYLIVGFTNTPWIGLAVSVIIMVAAMMVLSNMKGAMPWEKTAK